MKRDESGFRHFLVLPLTVALSALSIIFLFSATAASALTPQGKGGTIKPAPTPTPAPKKATTKRSAPTSTRVNAKPNESGKAGKVDASANERVFWESIRNSTNPEDFREYLRKYPNGEFTGLARNRLDALEAAAKEDAARKEEAKKAAQRPGAVIKNQMGMEFGYVPAGNFMMGSTDAETQAAYEDEKRYLPTIDMSFAFKFENPKHQVTIGEGFYMGRYEVTQAQWQEVMGNNPSKFKGCDNCPVEQVSWNDAQEFIRKLNARSDSYTYRLPTEAEWEYACRAGTTTAFAFGDSLSWDQANFDSYHPYGTGAKGTQLGKTTPVGSYQPNAWGLYDMHGNVEEWCEDWYHRDYKGVPTDGSAWLSGSVPPPARVFRGGSWNTDGYGLRSANRGFGSPNLRHPLNGFRLVAVARTQ
jgi:formylglycine-generating enzyme required for sulfatase activity